MNMGENCEYLDPRHLRLSGNFNSQVKEILWMTTLSKREEKDVVSLCKEIETIIKRIWHGSQLELFGSMLTGLGMKTSDVDCIAKLPKDCKDNMTFRVERVKGELEKNASFQQVAAVHRKHVSLIQMHHVATGQLHTLQVSFNGLVAVEVSKLVRYLLLADSRLLKLTILLKYWSKVHEVIGRKKMPTNSLTLLVIFYLQQQNILPSIAELQQNVPKKITDGWNTAFTQRDLTYDEKINIESVYYLLGGFFVFYRDFDFNNVVSLYLGRPITKLEMSDVNNLPSEFNHYKQCVRELGTSLVVNTQICLQDPFNHSRNHTIGMRPKEVKHVLQCFADAAYVYENYSDKYFLPNILFKT